MFFITGISPYIPWFCISRFCSIHFTVALVGLDNIVRYTGGNFVKQRFLISGFHYNFLCIGRRQNHVHLSNVGSTFVFSTFLECSQMVVVFYGKIMHGKEF